jgi:hypothetical protein
MANIIKTLISWLALLGIASNCYAIFEVDFSLEDDFSEMAVKRGVRATEDKCRLIPERAIWSRVNANLVECIKFWGQGLSSYTGRAIVYFHGDFTPPTSEYFKLSTERLNQSALTWSARLNAPVVFIGRPGVYGSSGNHSRRRLLEEGQVLSATLDGLKSKFGITEFVIVGQSGGGHLTTSLLTLRDDIVCAVPTSAPNSPRIRYLKMGRCVDTTGLQSYEPTENFNNPVHSGLRVIILGDPKDQNVFWESQVVLSNVLSQRRLPYILLQGEAKGPERHGLSISALRIAGMCFHDKTFDDMKAIEPTLKG